jgi:pimeloyl-ACP methyl ester carboxylesterase
LFNVCLMENLRMCLHSITRPVAFATAGGVGVKLFLFISVIKISFLMGDGEMKGEPMTVKTELCAFKTTDGETLHGLMLRGEKNISEAIALVLIHGVAMNFYSGPLPVFGKAFAEQGYDSLCMNTRGHDWISRAGDLTDFCGATYENLEDCLLDIDAAIDWLNLQGYKRCILIGHSLGAIKAIYYQGNRMRPEVIGVVSCSAPKQFYSARSIEQPGFKDRLLLAEEKLSSGKGEEFLWAPTSGAMGIFTARTYVSKYGRHENTDVRNQAERLGCCLLAIAGGAEGRFFRDYAKELAAAAEKSGSTLEVVPGSDHFYNEHASDVIAIISAWLLKTYS